MAGSTSLSSTATSSPHTTHPSSRRSTPPTDAENETSPLLKPGEPASGAKRILLKDFIKLNPDVSIYAPPAGTPPPPPEHPTTIIFCAWMNASLKHIDYYTRTYRSLYPHSRIITTRISTVQFMLTRESTRRRQVAPVVSALLSFERENGLENERLVVHQISNGGAKRSYGIAGLYLEQTGRTLPARAFLCDCTPGIPQWRRDLYSVSVPFAKMNLLARIPLYFFTIVMVSVVSVFVHWFPREFVWADLVWRPTRLFNEPGFLATKALKGYVYSGEDASIDYRDVEKHAEVAEKNGYRVLRKKVEGAGHALLWKGKGGGGGLLGLD